MYTKLIDLESTPYHSGFYAPGTAGQNSRFPILSTCEVDGMFGRMPALLPPHQIKLKVKLQPHKKMPSPQVWLQDQDRSYAPFSLMESPYWENSDFLKTGGFQGVDLLYDGVGEALYEAKAQEFHGIFLPSYELNLPQGIVYRHRFPCFQEGVLRQHCHYEGEKYQVDPCPIPNAWPRYGFGGFYAPQTSLKDIAPLYFSIGFDERAHPQVAVETTAEFQSAGIHPPEMGMLHGQKAVFMVVMEKEKFLSLADIIEQGYICLRIKTEGHGIETLTYASYSYEQSPQDIWILFKN